MKEEDRIIDRCGKGNHFTVPQGYFDDFAKNIMEQLPPRTLASDKKQSPTIFSRMRPWLYAAVALTGIFFGTRTVMHITSVNEVTTQTAQTDKVGLSDQDLQTMMRRSMVDDYALYQDLTEAE